MRLAFVAMLGTWIVLEICFGIVMMGLWLAFVAPVFGIRPITIFEAVGLSLLVTLPIVSSLDPQSGTPKTLGEYLDTFVIPNATRITFTSVVGLVVYLLNTLVH